MIVLIDVLVPYNSKFEWEFFSNCKELSQKNKTKQNKNSGIEISR
jgi:hypothetical protein